MGTVTPDVFTGVSGSEDAEGFPDGEAPDFRPAEEVPTDGALRPSDENAAQAETADASAAPLS